MSPRDPFGLKPQIRQNMAEAGLTVVFSLPHLEVYCDAAAPLKLADGSGVVLGPIFCKNGAMERVTAFGAVASERISGSRGQDLIEDCWGDYVAFVARSDSAIALRPPFGDLGCFHAAHRSLVLAASSLDLLARCGVPTNAPDWNEVAAHMRYGGLRESATCVQGVEEVLWGNRLVVTQDDVQTETCWDPWQFALAPRCGSRAELADELRELTLGCVKAQVRHLETIAAMLSGGLDSSILTACLVQSGVRLTCLNLPYGDAIGDERIYARAVSAHLGVPLFEVELDVHDVDVAHCGSPGLARPIARAFRQASRLARHRIAAAAGATAVVDGGGGDSLFCFMQSVAPVADRLRRHGPGRGMIETARDVARLTGASMMEVLMRTLRRAYLRSARHRWSVTERFLSPEAVSRAGPRSHGWLDAPRGALPGSATHIANLVVVENLIEIGFGPVAEWSPLMAQPLVEFCLSVPSWHWVENGHNRAVARRAFEHLLPPEIVWRRGKGTPDGFVATIFETYREKLAGLLIGGQLDQAGLLDIPAIEAALAAGQAVKGHDYNRLLRIADVEAWVRACQARHHTPLQAPPPAAPGGAQSVTSPPLSADPPDA